LVVFGKLMPLLAVNTPDTLAVEEAVIAPVKVEDPLTDRVLEERTEELVTLAPVIAAPVTLPDTYSGPVTEPPVN
jgi:hypothetical protein